jgi:CBS domain-containing protein
MKARDVMVSPVVTVKPQDTVKKVAELFLNRSISAAPVVDDHGKMIGIISEADLLHRSEICTERQHSRWVRLFVGDHDLAKEFIKSHAMKAADLMTHGVVTAAPETPLHHIAETMEKNAIKRVPIVRNGQLVGIVSRANLVQAIAAKAAGLEIQASDSRIREDLLTQLKTLGWLHSSIINPIVTDGVVNLWGLVDSSVDRTAVRIAAESTKGVRAVNDHMITGPVIGAFQLARGGSSSSADAMISTTRPALGDT